MSISIGGFVPVLPLTEAIAFNAFGRFFLSVTPAATGVSSDMSLPNSEDAILSSSDSSSLVVSCFGTGLSTL